MIGEPAAQKRTNEIREAIDHAKDALPLGALGRREDVTDHSEDQRDTDPRAQSLQRAEGNQLIHVLRGTGQR